MATLERSFLLPAFSELRVVTAANQREGTRVLLNMPVKGDAGGDSGSGLPRADVFGTELVPGVAVELPAARSVAIFSPTGCTLTVTAPPAVLQRTYSTAAGAVWMRSLLALHSHLEVQRVEAKAADMALGPRVLVVSDDSGVGASTYARMLSAYAVRLGYHPLLLDANPDRPRFGYPGCLSLFHLQNTIDVEEETGFMPGVHVYAGGSRTGATEGLYLRGVRDLVNLGIEKMARNDRCRVGGLFVDYGVISIGSVEAAERSEFRSKSGRAGEEAMQASSVANPIDLLLDTIAEADVDHVLVVQSGWLRHKIAQRAQERATAVAYQQESQPPPDVYMTQPAPAEVVHEALGLSFRLFLVDGIDHVSSFPPTLLRHQRWKQYFFGTATSVVKPTLAQFDTASLRIASVGSSQLSALSTLMPMMDENTADGGEGDGADGGSGYPSGRKVEPAAVSFVTTQDVDLQGRIVGISNATEMEALPDGSMQRVPYAEFERRVRQCVLVGFAFVESANAEKVTLLLNNVPLQKDLGICLVMMDEYLIKRP